MDKSAILALVFFLVGAGLQMSGWQNIYIAAACWVAAAILFVYSIRDFLPLEWLKEIIPPKSMVFIKQHPVVCLTIISIIIIAIIDCGIYWRVNTKVRVAKTKDALFNAQLKELQELDDFIGKKDENALRETFDFYNILKFNIKIARRGLAPKLVTPEESDEIDKFFEGGRSIINLKYVKVDANDPARMQLIPGKIGLLNISKKYIESRRLLVQFYSSSQLPVEIVNTLKDFDKAIKDNTNLMIEVLNERLADNIENIFGDDKDSSPCFNGTSRPYWSSFIQLRPKAEAVSIAIRDYLEVK